MQERLELPVPHSAVGDPGVDQHERLAVAGDVVVQRGAVYIREPFLRCSGHPGTSHAKKYARTIPNVL